MNGWAIYARQSQDRTGAGLAIERQVADCRKLGRQVKLAGEPTIYADNDISATNGKARPEYAKLLTALRGGKHKHLIVWHTDRLHRSPRELEDFIDALESHDVQISTVRSGELNLSTPSGRAIARTMGAWARLEVEQKGDRRRRAIQQQAENGERHGGARTFGYGRTVDGHSADIHKLNRREASAVAAAFDAILRGESTTSIWRSWNAKGLTTQHSGRWNGTNFRQLIERPSLAGLVTYKGEILEGVEAKWPAIVPVDKWRAVQAVISDPARRTSPGSVVSHLCSGLVFCECGRKMRARSNTLKLKSGEVDKFTVLKCITEAKGHSTIKETRLDERVRDAVVDALDDAKDKPPTASADDEAQLILLNKELAEAREGEARMTRMVKAGAISESAAIREGRETQAEIKRIGAEIDKLTQHVAAAGVDEALWDEIWAKASGPVLTPAGKGQQRFHGSRALVQSLMRRRGIGEEEAKGKIELYRRFDALSLDQRRALVRSMVRVTVLRGIHHGDRVAVEPL